MSKIFMKFCKDESGQALSEYALILALIAIVVVGVVSMLGTEIKEVFQNMIDSLTSSSS